MKLTDRLLTTRAVRPRTWQRLGLSSLAGEVAAVRAVDRARATIDGSEVAAGVSALRGGACARRYGSRHR
eukprot:482952-Prorocentrum_minimum.AAC.1